MTKEEVWQYFLSQLCNDEFDKDNFPNNIPYLAHYTSLDSAHQILKNGQLWFSNPLFMNDYEELRFGIHEGANVFRNHQDVKNACKTNKRYAKLMEFFEVALNEFNTGGVFDYYVFCLTKHEKNNSDGLLSMWRGYGGNGQGVALIFDPSKFPYDQENPIFIINEVLYLSRTERIEWLDRKISQFSKLLSQTELTEDQLYLPAYSILQRLKTFSLFSKHHGFREEQEWRIVYHPEYDRNGIFKDMIDYHINQNGIEPKFKFRVEPRADVLPQDFNFEKILKEIILGPTISSPLAKKSFERMLEKIDKSSLIQRARTSTTPYRP